MWLKYKKEQGSICTLRIIGAQDRVSLSEATLQFVIVLRQIRYIFVYNRTAIICLQHPTHLWCNALLCIATPKSHKIRGGC